MKIENLSESLKENSTQEPFYNVVSDDGGTSSIVCSPPDAGQSEELPKSALRRSLIVKQLETSLSPEMTTFKSVKGSPTNTSRYGRARKQKTYGDYFISDVVINTEATPYEKVPLKPLIKCYPSPKEKSAILIKTSPKEKSPISIKKSPKEKSEILIKKTYPSPKEKSAILINDAYNNFLYGDPSLVAKPVKKVYMRKDLIQRPKGIEATAHKFSPVKSPRSPNSVDYECKVNVKKELQLQTECNEMNEGGYDDICVDPETFIKQETEKFKPEEDTVEASCPWKVGDIAWARLGRHPFWPCMVTREPNTNIYVKQKRMSPANAINIIHITFFADFGRRCWILSTLMRKFTNIEDFYSERDAITPEMRKKNPKLSNAFSVSQKALPKWQSAVNEAKMILRRPQHLRTDFFVELTLNTNDSQKCFDSSNKKKINSENNEKGDILLSESLFEALFKTETSDDDDKIGDISSFSTSCVSNAIVQRKLKNQTHMDRWLLKAKTPLTKPSNGILQKMEDVRNKSPKIKMGIKSNSKSNIKLRQKSNGIIDNKSKSLKIKHNKVRSQKISNIFTTNNKITNNISSNSSNNEFTDTSNVNNALEKNIEPPSVNYIYDSRIDVSSSDDINDNTMSKEENVLLNYITDESIVTSTTLESMHTDESFDDKLDTELSEINVNDTEKNIKTLDPYINVDINKCDIISPDANEHSQMDTIVTPEKAHNESIIYKNVSGKSIEVDTNKKQTKIAPSKRNNKHFTGCPVSPSLSISLDVKQTINDLDDTDKTDQKEENRFLGITSDHVDVSSESSKLSFMFEKPCDKIDKAVNVSELLGPNLKTINESDTISTDASERSQIDTIETKEALNEIMLKMDNVSKETELAEIVNPVNVDLETDNEQTIPLSSRRKSTHSTYNTVSPTGLSSDKHQNVIKNNGKVSGKEYGLLTLKPDQVDISSVSKIDYESASKNHDSSSKNSESEISEKQCFELDTGVKVTEIIDDILKTIFHLNSDKSDIDSTDKSKDLKEHKTKRLNKSFEPTLNTNVSKEETEISKAAEVDLGTNNEQTIPLSSKRKSLRLTHSTVSSPDLSFDKEKNILNNTRKTHNLSIKEDLHGIETILEDIDSEEISKDIEKTNDEIEESNPKNNNSSKNQLVELNKGMKVTQIIDDILKTIFNKGDSVSTIKNEGLQVNTTKTLGDSPVEPLNGDIPEKSKLIQIAEASEADLGTNNEQTITLSSRRKSMRSTHSTVPPTALSSDNDQNINNLNGKETTGHKLFYKPVEENSLLEIKTDHSTKRKWKIIDTTSKKKSLRGINHSKSFEIEANVKPLSEHENSKHDVERMADTDSSESSVSPFNKKSTRRTRESLTFKEKISIVSSSDNECIEEFTVAANKTQQKLNTKEHKTKLNYNDPSFLFYYNTNIDLLFDRNPNMSSDEARNSLYDAWSYEQTTVNDNETLKREIESMVNPMIAGVDDVEGRVTPTVKRIKKVESNNTDKTAMIPRSKPTRAAVVRKYAEGNSDDEDIIENHSEDIPSKLQKASKQEETSKDGEADVENDDRENNDFMVDLLKPHPSIYKGLLKEKVCEKCEKPTNLIKCKGSCGGLYHVECMLIPAIALQDTSSKKIRGRKGKNKTKNSDVEISNEAAVGETEISNSNSILSDDPQSVQKHSILTANANDFEKQLFEKMKELIDESKVTYSPGSPDNSWEMEQVGKCEIVNYGESEIKDQVDEKCWQCVNYDMPVCFVCKSDKSPKDSMVRQRCSVPYCNKYYHLECLDRWPQTKFNSTVPSKNQKGQGTKNSLESIMCPRHTCHTCISDNPRANESRFLPDKLARCVRCPATYHQMDKCTPAGTTAITAMSILCPRHSDRSSSKIPYHVNTAWCFLCAKGGTLICCDTCPTSFHAECLNISPPEGGYICEDCETGRLPLIGELVWAKLGQYRWWPGYILHPTVIPKNILALPHQNNEFVVRFFGQHDHNWFKRGRVFPYQTGDTGYSSSKKTVIDIGFIKAVEEAQRASAILEGLQPEREREQSQMPPRFVKLKVNRPVGNLVSVPSHSAPACECRPDQNDPCGPNSDCLNRMLLTECSPQSCPAGTLCGNRGFEQRSYPNIGPARTNQRGWGLITNEDIVKGQFVVEYVGEVIDEVEFKRRMQRKHETKDENYYFLTLDKDRMIDAGPKGNYARFMNHSCEPNCETQKWTVNGDTRVGLFALNNIPAGSELTFNYKFDVSDGTGGRQKCFCGAKRCAGLIGAKLKQEETQPKKPLLKRKKQENLKRKYTKTSERWSKGSKESKERIPKRKHPKISAAKVISPPKMPSYVEDDLKLINGTCVTLELDKLSTHTSGSPEVPKRKHSHSPNDAENPLQKRVKTNESRNSVANPNKSNSFAKSDCRMNGFVQNGKASKRSRSRKST